MTPEAYQEFTDKLIARIAEDPDVLGLVALGSMSGESPAPDTWSDHDFFVVTRPGAQERFRTDPSWLPDASRIVLFHRETPHGVKAIWDDGHLAELAVFDQAELGLARVNRWRALLDRGGIAARMAEIRRATKERVRREAPDARWLAGQLLGALLVGAGRAARGERLSGHALVKHDAVRHLLVLLGRTASPAPGAAPDDLDPFRRAELAWPGTASAIEGALLLPVPRAAEALLDLAEQALGPGVPWSRAAAHAVRRRLREAAAGAR